MSYSRANPSPRYLELVDQYKTLHVEGEKILGLPPEKTFPGYSLLPQLERIKKHIELTKAETILDYGAGKGEQYQAPLVDMGGGVKEFVADYWDVYSVDCYDPAYSLYNELPTEKYDGVICTDVLEHCPREDVEWVINEIFSYAKKFVFANVACYPAKKTLPNGENAHCTIEASDWWVGYFRAASERYNIKVWELIVTQQVESGKLIETSFTG